MSALDRVAAVMAALIGFLFAMALVVVLELLAADFIVIAVALLILIAGIVLYEVVTERLLTNLARRVFRIPETEAEDEAWRSATIARYSATVGVVLAFLATRVWTPMEILGALP
jgi:hypothetical protein